MTATSATQLTSSGQPRNRGTRYVGRGTLVIALAAGLLLLTAPVASAAQPTRDRLTAQDSVIPAGFGCAFDVQAHFATGYNLAQLTFDDGRVMRTGSGVVTLTNLATGTTIEWRNGYQRTETFDAATNSLVADNNGRISLLYWPGDVDHTGQVVGASGALYGFVGHLHASLSFDTFAITSSELNGQAMDLCAALSE